MPPISVDLLRVATDRTYALGLSAEQWAGVLQSREFLSLGVSSPELAQAVAGVVAAVHGDVYQVPVVQNPSAQVADADLKVIRQPQIRTQGFGVVTGLGNYVEHMNVTNQIFMKALRSPHPHARVKAVDSSEAEKMPGVVAVLHRFNTPREYLNIKLGAGPPDRFLFPEEVFMAGVTVAIVGAESDEVADAAIRAIKVDYEVLPSVLDFLEGMRPTTPKQFDSKLDGTVSSVATPLMRGQGDAAFASADVVVEEVAIKPIEAQTALELTNSVMWWDGNRLTAYNTNQGPFGYRSSLAAAFNIPLNQVRWLNTGYMGSGYGFRALAEIDDVHPAVLAKITGRPVKTTLTRQEDATTRGHRPRFRNEMKLGVKRDGSLVAGHFKVIADIGAAKFAAAASAWFTMYNTYKIPNLTLEGVDVLTNNYPAFAYRCVMHPNGTFALETTMEKAAYSIGMDPVEFRLMNLNEIGNPDTAKPFSNPGLRDCITLAADRIGWKQKFHAAKANEVRPGVYHGIGLAAHACSHGAGGQPATGTLLLNPDGSIEAVSGSTEIGGGERTQMRMIAAEALGVAYESVSISASVDTDTTTDTGVSGGSQQTNSGGWGMYDAAMDARRQLFEIGARMFTGQVRRANPDAAAITADQLTITDGKWVTSKADATLKAKIGQVVTFGGGAVIGRGVHLQDPRWERTAWAAHAAEVEVDTVTGEVKVVSYVAAHDVGRIINRMGLEQQIEGGVVMSLGSTLYEELLTDKATGLPLNGNLLDYRIPSIKDVPEKVDVILVERPKEYGVYGAHGIGEPAMGPEGATIANAVYNAVGVWMTELPLTRERVLSGLKASA
jgi:xanthine dehydrogenase YagR molybdenum-binding subunit